MFLDRIILAILGPWIPTGPPGQDKVWNLLCPVASSFVLCLSLLSFLLFPLSPSILSHISSVSCSPLVSGLCSLFSSCLFPHTPPVLLSHILLSFLLCLLSSSVILCLISSVFLFLPLSSVFCPLLPSVLCTLPLLSFVICPLSFCPLSSPLPSIYCSFLVLCPPLSFSHLASVLLSSVRLTLSSFVLGFPVSLVF